MSACPSCQAEATPPRCSGCGALFPVPPAAGHFQVLGLPRSYFLDPVALEERFRELQRQLHPDRFVRRSAPERRRSLEWTTALNAAFRELKDPLARASYLLSGEGIDGGRGVTLPAEFLERMMVLREELEAARAAGELSRVRELAGGAKREAERLEEELAAAMRSFEREGARAALQRAAAAVCRLRYYRRVAEEAATVELAALEPAPRPGRAG